MFLKSALPIALGIVLIAGLHAEEDGLGPNVSDKVATIARSTLKATGVPSASIAIVEDGKIALVKAYGKAALQPPREAEPSMRYAVGSISKQFTAAAILMLVEQGKLQLD